MSSSIFKPYDSEHKNSLSCSCGRHDSEAEHNQEQQRLDNARARNPETLSDDVVEESLMRALFPIDSVRRDFLRAVGANTARAAISSVLPLTALQAMAQEKNGAIEKKDLKIGFIIFSYNIYLTTILI